MRHIGRVAGMALALVFGFSVASAQLADLEERWGKGLFPGERWVGLIYEGLE